MSKIQLRKNILNVKKVFGTVEEMAAVVARARLEADLDNALLHLNDTQRSLRHTRRPHSKNQGMGGLGGCSVPRDFSLSPGSLSSFDELNSTSKNEHDRRRNSLSFCGISNSSGDSAISTAHSQSEISSKESSPKEFRLSFVFHQAMATLEESRLNFRQSRSIFNDEDDEDSQKSYSSVNESLNLSQFSSGTSNFESDCEDDYELPGPVLHIEETPNPSPLPNGAQLDTFDKLQSTLNTTCSRSNTLASTSTNVSSALSTIFAGDYLRCDKSETSSISSVTKRYRLSEYHYSKLAESQSLQKCTTEGISENRDDTENYQKIIRRCLSAPDVKLLNCENCQVLKHSMCELLSDCGELNQLLKQLISILKTPKKESRSAQPNKLTPNLLNQISSIDHMITKKQNEIDNLLNGLEKK